MHILKLLEVRLRFSVSTSWQNAANCLDSFSEVTFSV